MVLCKYLLNLRSTGIVHHPMVTVRVRVRVNDRIRVKVTVRLG